jgi:hypothetical protein
MDRAGFRSRAAGTDYVRLSRSQRDAQNSSRFLLMAAAILSVALGLLLHAITPREQPLVTIYMHSDCASCARWLEHLAARGFRTEVGNEADWPAIRASFGIAPELESCHTAVVDGLFIEGPVPAGDIHRALRLRKLFHLRGLVLPGVPRGSPGSESPLPLPYTVLVMREGGRVHEFAEHNR